MSNHRVQVNEGTTGWLQCRLHSQKKNLDCLIKRLRKALLPEVWAMHATSRPRIHCLFRSVCCWKAMTACVWRPAWNCCIWCGGFANYWYCDLFSKT